MEEVLDTIEFQLEGRFTKMRKCETNLGIKDGCFIKLCFSVVGHN